MAKISKDTASETMAVDGYEGHFQDLEGYTVAYEALGPMSARRSSPRQVIPTPKMAMYRYLPRRAMS